MMEQPVKVVDEKGKELPHTKCPRCGTFNVFVKPKDHGIRMLNGIVYELYMTVCRECGLLFTDAFVEARK